MKFISPDSKVGYIRAIDSFLDIEYSDNFDYIKNSNKILLVWNYYACHVSKEERWKLNNKIWNWYRQNNKLSYCMERGALPNTVFIDGNGFNVDSSSYNENNWNHILKEEEYFQAEHFIKTFTEDASSLEKQQTQRISKENFYEKLNLDNRIKVFVPLQVPWDSTILLWSDWVKGVEKFIKIVDALSKENKDILFLMKAHPLGNLGIPNRENTRNLWDYHYKDCIKYSDKVLCINSGLGLQSMMWKKPTIVVGKTFYQFKDINYKANDEYEIIKLIKTAKAPNFDKVRRFIYFLMFKFYSDCDTKKIVFKNVRLYPNI